MRNRTAKIVGTLILSICLSSNLRGEFVLAFEFDFPDVAVQYNGALTNIGAHQFRFLVDSQAADLDSSDMFGAFPTSFASITAPSLGLFDVEILTPTHLFTNTLGNQLALRLGTPGIFAGQFTNVEMLPAFMSDANDLGTLQLPYTGTSTMVGWRTDGPGGGDVLLASGDIFNGGTNQVGTGLATFSISAVPEPHSLVFVLVGLGCIAPRRYRQT